MNAAQLRKVKRGDIVKASIKGREFYAEAGRLDARDGTNGVTVEPLPVKGSAISSRWVSGADIIAHWRRVDL